jgi:putative ABC transport system substrate-binding protein
VTPVTRRSVLGGLARLSVSAAGLALASSCGFQPFATQPRIARVGLSWSGAPENAAGIDAFRAGLREAGWVEGQNLIIDERHYEDHPERMSDLAAELVALKPDVLVGSQVPSLAFMRATDSIPIVFGGVADPVGLGLIASYARPGGNVTGTSRTAGSTLTRKLLDVLRQLVPGLARVAVAFDPRIPSSVTDVGDSQAAAQALGIDVQAVGISSSGDLERALEAALAGHPQALIGAAGGVNPLLHPAVAGFATRHGLPSASTNTATAGYLLYYGPDLSALHHRAGNYYVDRILRGVKPADLPVEGPTVFNLTVNRATAQALGLTIPPDVAAQVTEWVQ